MAAEVNPLLIPRSPHKKREHTSPFENLRDLLHQAMSGRLAVLIAHDTAKQIWCLRERGRRLSRVMALGGVPTHEAQALVELAEEALLGLRRIVTNENLSAQFRSDGVSVGAAVDRAVATVHRTRAGARIEAEYEGAVRDAELPGLAIAVVENLIDNAVLAGSDAVQIRATLQGSDIVVEVLDRGQGLPSAAIRREGRVGSTPRPRAGGQGVGLAVSRQVVEFVGGTLHLRSRLGGGVSATVRFPRADSKD